MWSIAAHSFTQSTKKQVGAAANSADVRLAATITEPESGLKMTVLTNAPGIHFYSGNFMNSKDGSAGRIPNKGGLRYEQHTGGHRLCGG